MVNDIFLSDKGAGKKSKGSLAGKMKRRLENSAKAGNQSESLSGKQNKIQRAMREGRWDKPQYVEWALERSVRIRNGVSITIEGSGIHLQQSLEPTGIIPCDPHIGPNRETFIALIL